MPATQSKRQNVLAFLGQQPGQFQSFVFEGAIDAHTAVHCFEVFSRLIDKETRVVVDNAPTHAGEEFEG